MHLFCARTWLFITTLRWMKTTTESNGDAGNKRIKLEPIYTSQNTSSCPYLSTINRNLLDFGRERVLYFYVSYIFRFVQLHWVIRMYTAVLFAVSFFKVEDLKQSLWHIAYRNNIAFSYNCQHPKCSVFPKTMKW